MTDSLIITLPGLPPASYSPNSRVPYWARSKDSHDLLDDLRILLIEAGWDHKRIPMPRARVTFHLDKRRRDHDNLIPRLKPVWDNLVRAGVIEDDSLRVLGWPEYRHEYGKPKTVIELWSAKVGHTHTAKLSGG